MSSISVKIEGTDEMKRTLKEFRNDTFKKKVLTSAFRKAAKPFIQAARANAPIADEDGKDRSGNVIPVGWTKKHVKSWTYRNIRSPHLLMGVKLSRKEKSDGGYWLHKYAELGTVHRPAKPFLRPAWDNTKGMMSGIVGSEFDKVFKKFKSKYNL